MKFISPLSDPAQATLNDAYHDHPKSRVRQRAHAVLLNNRRYTMTQISDLFGVQLETVSGWLNRWEAQGLSGLFDAPRSGRPPRFESDEIETFIRYIETNPHQRKDAAARLQEETGKTASADTFRRLLKKKTTAGNGVEQRSKASVMRTCLHAIPRS